MVRGTNWGGKFQTTVSWMCKKWGDTKTLNKRALSRYLTMKHKITLKRYAGPKVYFGVFTTRWKKPKNVKVETFLEVDV